MNHNEKLQQYARLIVKTGANVQKDQYVVLNCGIENVSFGRMVVEEAYKAGARDVIVFWNDVRTSRIRFDYAAMAELENIPEWRAESRNYYAREKAAFIAVTGSDPEAFLGVDSEKLKTSSRAADTAFKTYYKMMMASEMQWCVAAVPEEKWAQKVFPDLDRDAAMEKLWQAIFESVRIGREDAVKAWEKHNALLTEKCKMLNDYHFKKLRYRNSIGTDFVIGLQQDHIWEGGSEFTPDRTPFFANMPTEEIYTAPDCNYAQGTVAASMPLCHQGNLIENFSVTFHDGKVTDFKAEKGYDILKMIIEMDEGSGRLGEVALVPYDSPISNMGILFYDTLFDENAACHLAFGECYPTTIRNGGSMSKEELKAAGANQSMTHVDFMIGTKDLEITGIRADGTEICIFRNGNWA